MKKGSLLKYTIGISCLIYAIYSLAVWFIVIVAMILHRTDENLTIIGFIEHFLYFFIDLPLLVGSIGIFLSKRWASIFLILGAAINIILIINTAIFTKMLLNWGIVMLVFFILIFSLSLIFHKESA